VVVAVGPNATSFKVGDKVIPTCFTDWITGRIGETRSLGNKNDGVLREYMTVEERGLVRMPSNYTFAEASTLACAALTAWNALYGLKRVMPGDWVLTEGTGGVSLFAIQVSNVSSPTPLHLCPDTSLPKSQVHE
jgi:NADPH:quinone reductase-like Zn-dependent oxidoreductase